MTSLTWFYKRTWCEITSWKLTCRGYSWQTLLDLERIQTHINSRVVLTPGVELFPYVALLSLNIVPEDVALLPVNCEKYNSNEKAGHYVKESQTQK